MDNQNQQTNQNQGPTEGAGYDTPGQDTIIHSTSSAVPSPSKTSEERLTTPDPVIKSLDETPGDSNPALDETAEFEQGKATTADLLRARETAEEQGPRATGNVYPYEDQEPGDVPDEFERTGTDRPVWPNDRKEAPMEYMESPRADLPLMSGSADKMPDLKGRADATMDRDSTESAANTTRSGLPPVGFDAEEDIYEEREMHTQAPPSEVGQIAPEMRNIPTEEENA